MKRKNRFALNEDCFLVKGAKRGAIYDLKTGDIYSIDEKSKQILDLCEKGNTLGDIYGCISGISQKEIRDYIGKLGELKLGRFLKKGETISKIALEPSPQKLDFIWLELTEKCNLRCLHCYADFEPSRLGSNQQGLSLENWKEVIREATGLGCRKLQFIGGEPMRFGRKIFDLVKLANELNYKVVEIFTNATLLSKEDTKLIAKYGVKVAVSLYSKKAIIHDGITQVEGSYEKTIANIKKLQDYNIKFRIGLVVMKQNQDFLEETLDFVKKLGVENSGSFDLVRNVGRGKKKDLIPDKLIDSRLKKEADFQKISKQDFIKRIKGHSCWQDKLCVTSNGDVLPCIMAREEICGNIKKQSLAEIVQSEDLQNLWGLSKDKIEICKDCEYRYVCFDCRPQAKSEDDLYARGKDCLYNPFEGRWESKN